MDVNLPMASPPAKGLSQRVIAESGSIPLAGGAMPLAQAEQQGVRFAGLALRQKQYEAFAEWLKKSPGKPAGAH